MSAGIIASLKAHNTSLIVNMSRKDHQNTHHIRVANPLKEHNIDILMGRQRNFHQEITLVYICRFILNDI